MLRDKVAIITGGGRGIGKGIALKFAAAGCSIVIADIHLSGSHDIAINTSGHRKQEELAIQCDISDINQVKNLVDQVIEKYGEVDILVNCAGIGGKSRPIEEVPEDEWDKVLAVNLKGVFLCCKAVVPFMKSKRSGNIINISSGVATFPVSPRIPYIASKAGVLGVTVDLALELAPFNIRVNAILPGPVRTELWDPQIPSDVDKDAFFDNIGKKTVPMQRVGTPADIAGAALFLASDLSSYITGSQIDVGGGLPYNYPKL